MTRQEAWEKIATAAGWPATDPTVIHMIAQFEGFLADVYKNHSDVEFTVSAKGGKLIDYTWRDRPTGKLLGSGTFRPDGTVDRF